MGGEVILLVEKGPYQKVKKFFEGHFEKDKDGTFWSKAPCDNDAGCWIEFKGRGRIDVGYQMYEYSSKWADAIACAIRDHFRIKKGGWDSVGYCKDFMFTRPWQVNIRFAERALKRKPELAKTKPGLVTEGTIFDDIKEYKRLQKQYESAANKIFKDIPKVKYNLKPLPPEKEPDPPLKEFKIVWKKGVGQQGGKKILIRTAIAKELEKDRFILYPVMIDANMWCLYDSKNRTQHYLMKENAGSRIFEILGKEEF